MAPQDLTTISGGQTGPDRAGLSLAETPLTGCTMQSFLEKLWQTSNLAINRACLHCRLDSHRPGVQERDRAKDTYLPCAAYFWPLPLSATASFRWSAVITTSVAASTVSSAVLMVTSSFKGSRAF